MLKKQIEKADFNPDHHTFSYSLSCALLSLAFFAISYQQRASSTISRDIFRAMSPSKQAIVIQQRFIVDISMYLQSLVAFLFLAFNFMMNVNRERETVAQKQWKMLVAKRANLARAAGAEEL